MAERRNIRPGDLVIHHKIMYEAGYVTRYGFVIGVRHPRTGGHMGCEERIDVMWDEARDGQRFETVCDCGLLTTEDLA